MILQRPQATAALAAGRDVDWDERGGRGRAGGLRAGRGHRPALHPLHLGHHRQAQGRRPRQRRPRGRAALDRCERLRHRRRARCSGPPPTSAGWSATPTSSTRRCWPAHHRAVRGQAGRHAGRRARSGGSIAEHGVQGAVHRADRVPGDHARRTRTASSPAKYDLSSAAVRCSWPASGSTRRPTSGPANCSASR